jgi:hypothetical protein
MSKQVHDPWKDVLKRARTDPAYRQALKADPAKVLAEAGVKVDKATEYVVLEQTPRKVYLVLPQLVGEGELSDEALETVAGGAFGRRPGVQNFSSSDDSWPNV